MRMRIMAIDYGDARTGVAVSDETATIAGEAWVIREKSMEALVKAIVAASVSRGVSAIVIGYPKNMNGTIGPRAEKSELLSELLRARMKRLTKSVSGEASEPQTDEAPGDVEVVLWDERMTTMSAHRILSDTGRYGKKRKDTVDAVAASLILEGYLRYRSQGARD